MLRFAGAALLVVTFGLPAAVAAQEWVYTVRPGDTLGDIAGRFFVRRELWRNFADINGVRDPLNLPIGEQLIAPADWLRAQPVPAEVVAFSGEVTILRGPATNVPSGVFQAPQPVEQGGLIHAGDRLVTGEGGSATVRFADGSQLLINASSELIFDQLTAYQDTGQVDTRLRLRSGETVNSVDPNGSSDNFTITTPTVSATVRGTEFRARTLDGDVALLEVLTGALALDDGSTRELPTLQAGFGARAAADAAAITPVALLPAPDRAQEGPIERLPASVALTPVIGADAYRVLLADTAEFATVRYNVVNTTPTLSLGDIPDGDYVLRARAIDPLSIEGLNAVFAVTVNARPVPPAPQAPLDDSSIFDPLSVWRWAAIADATVGYRLQLTAGEDTAFADPLLDLTLAANEAQPPAPLDLGVYRWRVATIIGDEQGPFSDVQVITLRAPPEVAPPEFDGDTIRLRFDEGPPGTRYEYQLALNVNFRAPIAEGRSTTPLVSLSAPRFAGDALYVRARSILADGTVGPFGPILRIDLDPWQQFKRSFVPEASAE